MRGFFTYLLTAALIATSLVLGTASNSYAAAGNHTPITWNMQGGNANKWTTVASMANGRGNNFLPHDVIALQESGPLSSVPGTTEYTGTWVLSGAQYEVVTRRWHVGTASRGRDVWITWVNTDPTGNRNNVAIVTHERVDHSYFSLIHALNANGSRGARPALGVQLADGSQFYSFHASSNGDNSSNDAQSLINYISQSRGGTSWAVLGDFNRRPELLTLPSGTGLYRSGQGTHQGGGELDYMVSNDTQNMAGWSGRRLGIGGSDHFAVEFQFRASAERWAIVEGGDNDRCLNATSGGGVNADHCDGIGYEEWSWQGPYLMMEKDGKVQCLDVKNEGTSNGTDVITYPCNMQSNQQFVRQADGTIKSLSSGRCLDAWDGWPSLYDCNPDTFNQQFVTIASAPFVWEPLTTSWNGLDH